MWSPAIRLVNSFKPKIQSPKDINIPDDQKTIIESVNSS